MALITADEFPAIRAVIRVDLDEVSLPDTVIALPIFLGAADADTKRLDPLWASRTSDALRHLKNAVIYYTAARIVLSLSRPSTETFGQRYSYKIDQLAANELASSLQSQGDDEVNQVLNPGSDDVIEQPTTFTLGQACRPRLRRVWI